MNKQRDMFLARHGIKVLRYSNYEVNNRFNVVCEDIMNALRTPHPSALPTPSPQGEGFGFVF